MPKPQTKSRQTRSRRVLREKECSREKAMPPPHSIDLIRKHELAKRLGINRWTLMRWCKERKFPQPIRLSDVVIAWRVSEVEAWLQQRATDAA